MKLGASQALMWEVMLDLKQRGVKTLTLGGAPDGGTDGLNRYKLGFGAYEVNASNYQIRTGGPVIAAIVSAARRALQLIPGRLIGQGST
jgi:lipid II:glycine glycyltransferase (peptidoglycan interpeptide bridge formation enzyme)